LRFFGKLNHHFRIGGALRQRIVRVNGLFERRHLAHQRLSDGRIVPKIGGSGERFDLADAFSF
jgi:hypothetical protein